MITITMKGVQIQIFVPTPEHRETFDMIEQDERIELRKKYEEVRDVLKFALLLLVSGTACCMKHSMLISEIAAFMCASDYQEVKVEELLLEFENLQL